VIQYSVPAKYSTPVVRPSPNAVAIEELCSATRRGTSAPQAIAEWPRLGKLRMSRTPEQTASAY
jgi:hypothetical protein